MIQFIVVCNSETQKLEVVVPKDTTNPKYTVVKRKLANRKVAQSWIEKNHPGGSCDKNGKTIEKIKPGIPKSAGNPKNKSLEKSPPPKRIKHFYRHKVLFSYGRTQFNIDEMPGFTHVIDKGEFCSFRYQKGNKVQWGFYGDYNYYGTVRSYKSSTNYEEVKWNNVDAGMLFSVPIELHRKSGKIWFLPEVGFGASFQNLSKAKPKDHTLDVLNGGWHYFYRLSLEIYRINFSLQGFGMFQETIEEHPNFKLKGTRLGIGLAI